MKFTNAVAVTILASAVYATPQATPTSASSSPSAAATTDAPTVTYTPSPQEQCVSSSCQGKDARCTASCWGVPAPNTDMANDTTECAAKCPQGDGSPEQTDKFAACVQGCISASFFAPGGGPKTAGGSGSGNDNAGGSGGTATDGGAQATGSSGSPGASQSASSTAGAVAGQAIAPVTGFFGLLVALFAVAL